MGTCLYDRIAYESISELARQMLLKFGAASSHNTATSRDVKVHFDGFDCLPVYSIYSEPEPEDQYDSAGHINAKYIVERVPNVTEASFYICGPQHFIADIQTGLEEEGVTSQNIFFESF
jgi:uncharacterized protein